MIVLDEAILEDIKSIRIRAQLLDESAAKLEERLAGGVSTPPKKSGNVLNEKQLEGLVFNRKKRMQKTKRK